MSDREKKLVVERPEQLWLPGTRRGFLRMLGMGGAVVLLPSVFAACGDDDPVGPGNGDGVTLDLGDDTGILNYAYALEQLEAGFYSSVLAAPAFAELSAGEKEVLTDLRNHEVIHRQFLRQVLGEARIPDLALDTATVAAAIASREAILETAETFEDLGVAAYNGAGKYLQSGDNLLVAGKIVSVEARHAAAIRDMRDGTAGTRFANGDVVDGNGLDVKLEPSAVFAIVADSGFVETTVELGDPPRSGRPGTTDFAPSHD